MPTRRALLLCPVLTLAPPHFAAYREASGEVMAVIGDVTPLVEQISIDEAFLDISDMPDAPHAVARELQRRVNDRLRLPCSLGAATNKLVAKIANNVGKASGPGNRPPNAITVVPPGAEAGFLAPLDVEDLWGVGPKTAARLRELGMNTIGDVASWPAADLARLLGRTGDDLSLRARGIDDRPVEDQHQAKSISEETTFASDTSDSIVLRRTLRRLAEDVGFRLRKAGLTGSTVRLKLRWADFTTVSRQETLERPTDMDQEIYALADELFRNTWRQGRRVRLLGVGVAGLTESGYQLGLWQRGEQTRARELQTTVDGLRKRFGHHAIFRASNLEDE